MQILDISMAIDSNMAVYHNKAEKRPQIFTTKDFSSGDLYETNLSMNLHTGTHIDLPLHVIPGGASSDQLDISKLITSCCVLDFTHATEKITAVDLKTKKIEPEMFVLIKTTSSFSDQFMTNFVYLDASGANYLTDLAVPGVGIDSLGIERGQPDHITHKILLEAGVIIIEGLRLSSVEAGIYQLIALPLKINAVEAVPARVILIPGKPC